MQKLGYTAALTAILALLLTACAFFPVTLPAETTEKPQITTTAPPTETAASPTLPTEAPEAPTEPSATEPTTQPTEPETTAPTEPETTAPTEPETTAPTEPETTAPTEAAPADGWQEIDGKRYYIPENGEPAKGKVEINGKTYYFSSQGEEILLANPWNFIHDDYAPDLVELSLSISVEGMYVDRSCYDALVRMMNDCNKECPEACVVSAYRTMDHQTNNYNRKVKYYLDQGYNQAEAEELAAKIIAVPGTSEHQLGLAVDIVDTRLWALENEQAELPAQKWLMENCYKYGFILRYPQDKTDVTGIIYEPWHYRYVGTDVAKELYSAGLTLEEYLDGLS